MRLLSQPLQTPRYEAQRGAIGWDLLRYDEVRYLANDEVRIELKALYFS